MNFNVNKTHQLSFFSPIQIIIIIQLCASETGGVIQAHLRNVHVQIIQHTQLYTCVTT